MADPHHSFLHKDPPADGELAAALDGMILSVSGWRKIFAPGGEEDGKTPPSQADLLLAAGMGKAFSSLLSGIAEKIRSDVLVAVDSRPTGPALADTLMRALLASGRRPRYLFIAAAPEMMAYAAEEETPFAYLSASHNPLAYNGVKFGLGGSVLQGSLARELIALYRGLLGAPGAAAGLHSLISGVGKPEMEEIYRSAAEEKRRALKVYKAFTERVAAEDGRPGVLRDLREALVHRPLTVTADLNGSARTVSADRSYLEGLGVKLKTINAVPGLVVHAVIPEGESLEPCRRFLEDVHRKDGGAVLGYVTDNDGDRGNLVYWDAWGGRARTLLAQEVFALITLAGLAAWTGEGRRAIVVNGPTSLRIGVIAALYGVEVHETEVGEANLVERAAALRREGCAVRLSGEGSNGGVIIHPAAVRDPLNTVSALLKLLRPSLSAESPFEDWCRRLGHPEFHKEPYGLSDILDTLPRWTTTVASHPRAMMRIRSTDHGALKRSWEALFLREWDRRSREMEHRYGFASWEAVNNEGAVSRLGLGSANRSGAETGGFKLLFKNRGGEAMGFLWMRGSGTEPVFRVLVDLKGNDPGGEEALLTWHRALVNEADRIATGIPPEGNLPDPVSINETETGKVSPPP